LTLDGDLVVELVGLAVDLDSLKQEALKAGHVKNAVLDWVTAVNGELQVELLLLGHLGLATLGRLGLVNGLLGLLDGWLGSWLGGWLGGWLCGRSSGSLSGCLNLGLGLSHFQVCD